MHDNLFELIKEFIITTRKMAFYDTETTTVIGESP